MHRSATRHHLLVHELAKMAPVWEHLLARHLPDRHGRCCGCTQGGTGLPGGRWPCVLRGLAELARSTSTDR